MENLQCLPIGTIIPGTTYRIEKVLGQGSFGITYRVYDTVLEDVYALKEFFPQDLSDRNSSVSLMLETPSKKVEQFETLKKKFISEAKSLKACQHPGIVNIRMFINSMDTVYYLMDFIDGETLSKKYTGKPLDAGEAIAMIQRIAEPLKHIHKKNIVHFDLNPNNVMVRSDGSIVLIDFGFAKRYDQLGNQMSSLLVAGGTMGYIAPEQVGGVIKEFTPRTDIYALGGILYFLLTGHAPVSYQAILQDDSALLDELPEKFHSFFQKAMALRVKDRFASVDEFIDGLFDIIKVDSKNELLYKRIPRGDGKWNFVNANGEYLSEQWFENTCSFSEGWAEVKLDGKWNFVNANGEYLSEQWFEWTWPFSKGWAKVGLEMIWDSEAQAWHAFGNYNFINCKGEYLSKKCFSEAEPFSEGWAGVELDGKWNFINCKGEYLSDKWFNKVEPFSEGWAKVELDDKFNFVNYNGEYLSEQWFECVGHFSEGWGDVCLNDQYNFINSKGEYLSDQWFDWLMSGFVEGWAGVALNGELNFINCKGKYLSEQWFETIEWFSEGWAGVKLNGEWNFINSKGKYLSDQWFDEIVEMMSLGGDDEKYFWNGWARVKLNGKWNYINSDGNYLSDQWFEGADDFFDGWAKIQLNGDKYFINTEGKLVKRYTIIDLDEILGK